MSIFKCKMCGGALEISGGETVVTCEYCGTQQTLPRLDDDRRVNLYDRANHFRRSNDFDKAMGIYEQILTEDGSDAEAYWSLVLCRYGIEYVEDPASHKRIPTVNRAQFTSIFDDDNYKSALQYADASQRVIYEQEAKAINEIQKGILAISQQEEPFDVFICYKETDANGRRTPDSVLANDLYHQLTQEGFKVFFARITLEDKLGSAYEPYIFAALNSAKVMVVLGTKPEYFNAVWVKNEWSRYLSLIKQGQKKMLIPAYKDMDPYDLPEEFSHLQAQDMSKLGFMQDLIRGIKKIAQSDEPKQTVVKETVVTGGAANAAPLLRRAMLFLEDGDWASADEYCEKVLDLNPENAQAYLGKLMAELHVRRQEDLKNCAEPFDGLNNYIKTLRFADEKLRKALEGYISYIKERNETARLNRLYSEALMLMQNAKDEAAFKEAAKKFFDLDTFEDSQAQAEKCLELAEAARVGVVLNLAKERMNTASYYAAISVLEPIAGRKEADEMISACKQKIEKLEQKREQNVKVVKKVAKIVVPIVVVVIAFLVVLTKVIIPNGKYNDAIALMEAGQYEEAIAAFDAMDGYKDSAEKIEECKTGILDDSYNASIVLMDAGEYEQAVEGFELLAEHDFKDSAAMVEMCKTAILDRKYEEGNALMASGQYEEAIAVFEAVDEYENSADSIVECRYRQAVEQMEAGKTIEAYEAFVALVDYKDSAEKAESLYGVYQTEKFKQARIGDLVFFGSYEQDNDVTNGKEKIEWIVLDIQDGKALLISKYALDCQPRLINENWETCSLRTWLNEEFLNAAFSEDEQALIPATTVLSDGWDGGKITVETQDRVFLMGIYDDCSGALGLCQPTAYAIANGAWVSSDSGECAYYVRDTDAFCSPNDFDRNCDFETEVAARPMIWVDLGE